MKTRMNGQAMPVLRRWLAGLVLGVLATSAHAEMVTDTLFESTTLVTGTSLTLTELNLTTPGKLIIDLDDLGWPTLLSTLSFCISDATHVLQSYVLSDTASGSWSFDVQAAGTLYATIFAKPDAAAKAGMYHVEVGFEHGSPVPLPAAVWFLLSGLAGLTAFRPKHKLSQSYA